MMRVLCILVEMTVPVRIRPRMETRPVNGHFLSVREDICQLCLRAATSISQIHGELLYENERSGGDVVPM